MSDRFHFAETCSSVLIGGEETSGRYALILAIAGAGSQTPFHAHDKDAEIVHVLGGALQVEDGGAPVRLGPGDTGVLREGRAHRLSPVADAPMPLYALICAPAGFERFIRAVGEPAERDAPPRPMTLEEQERLVRRAGEFGVRLLDPASLTSNGIGPAATGNCWGRLNVMGAEIETVASLGDGADDLCVMRQSVPSGMIVPLHSHVDPESFFVISGELEIHVETKGWRTLAQGEAIHVPPDAKHAVRNISVEPATILMISSTRIAAFFREIAAPEGAEAVPPGPAAMAQLVAAAAARGYWLASPDENATIGIALP